MTTRVPRVLMVAGEASGDLNGASLAEHLRELIPGIDIYGIGGRQMRKAGVRLLHDSSAWSAIGLGEALKLIPSLLVLQSRLLARVKADPPDLVILIDFGGFNLRLAKHLPKSVKVLYFYPPGSWNRSYSYYKLNGLVDRVVTPFPWSAETLKKEGFNAEFFGHPLLDLTMPKQSRLDFCASYGVDTRRLMVGLLPGSRKMEIIHNLPSLIVAAGRMSQMKPDLQFVIPLASSVNRQNLERELRLIPWLNVKVGKESSGTAGFGGRLGLAGNVRAWGKSEEFTEPSAPVSITLVPGHSAEVLAYSQAAVVASGSATLEASILGCPMVIMYRGSRIMMLEYALRRTKIKFMGMPNILLDRMICPELLQDDANPGRIADKMIEIIEDTPVRREMLRNLAEARAMLGETGAVSRTAVVVREMLDQMSDGENG